MSKRTLEINIADAEVIHEALVEWMNNQPDRSKEEKFTMEDVFYVIAEQTLEKVHEFLMKELPPEEKARYEFANVH